MTYAESPERRGTVSEFLLHRGDRLELTGVRFDARKIADKAPRIRLESLSDPLSIEGGYNVFETHTIAGLAANLVLSAKAEESAPRKAEELDGLGDRHILREVVRDNVTCTMIYIDRSVEGFHFATNNNTLPLSRDSQRPCRVARCLI